MIELSSAQIMALFCLPTIVTGFFLWRIKVGIEKREKKHEKQEAAKQKKEILNVQGIRAAISLGEATARVIRMNNPENCNGEMSRALEYAQKVKLEQKEFYEKQGIASLH